MNGRLLTPLVFRRHAAGLRDAPVCRNYSHKQCMFKLCDDEQRTTKPSLLCQLLQPMASYITKTAKKKRN